MPSICAGTRLRSSAATPSAFPFSSTTFAKAKELGFTHFFSSLLYSKYQPHEAIKTAGERLSGQDGGPLFLYRDFRPYWQAGIDLSISMDLYRQPYCGCVYSETDRYHKKLDRLVKAQRKAEESVR